MERYTENSVKAIGKTYNFAVSERRDINKALVSLFVLSTICLLGHFAGSVAGKVQPPLHGPSLTQSSQEVVLAQEPPKPLTWNDAIRAVFPKDEADRMIRICIAENPQQDKTIVSYNDNGTYDTSWCQVNSVHKPKEMSDEEWQKNLMDPVFHAKTVREIFLHQWWPAWSKYKFGGVR